MCSDYNCIKDSIDTPTVLHHMRALVTFSNSYMSECEMPNICLLSQIAKYLTYLFKVMLFIVTRVIRCIAKYSGFWCV